MREINYNLSVRLTAFLKTQMIYPKDYTITMNKKETIKMFKEIKYEINEFQIEKGGKFLGFEFKVTNRKGITIKLK